MFNKKFKEVSKELEKLREELKQLNEQTQKRTIMEVIIAKRVKKEKSDELGRVYEILDGGKFYYDADRSYCICSRDCTERQFIEFINIKTREIEFLREIHEDEFFTITKVES